MLRVYMTPKSLSLVAIMGALGNVLAMISISLGLIPTPVPQVALDFSNLAVVIVAVYCGARLGGITGLIAGIVPAIMFGFVIGSTGPLTFLIPVGKALTGITVGALASLFNIAKKPRRSFLVIPLVLIGFIPENLFTILYFLVLVPLFIPQFPLAALMPIAVTVTLKGWVELLIIGFLMGSLIGNAGFTTFMKRYTTISQTP